MSSERSASTFRRPTATKAEQKMMELLSAANIHYSWQWPVERTDEYTSAGNLKTYWSDFFTSHEFAARPVLVEIDGDAHNGNEEYDAKRNRYLESRGYRVMHFSNKMVLHKGKEVIQAIQTELRRVKV